MPMNNNLIDGLLNLLFKNTAFANVGDTSGLQGSAGAGSFYLSLHTSDPGASGSQNTNEVSYTGYARVPVARDGSHWTLASHAISPQATISFGQCTAGTATAAYAGIGTASSGAGELLWSGAISPNIAISNTVIPELTTSTSISLT